MTNINEVVLKRFGISAFVSSAKNRVLMRRIAGKGTASNRTNGQFQCGVTIPADIFNVDDLAHLYEVHRDVSGNYIFIKTDIVDKETLERYS